MEVVEEVEVVEVVVGVMGGVKRQALMRSLSFWVCVAELKWERGTVAAK